MHPPDRDRARKNFSRQSGGYTKHTGALAIHRGKQLLGTGLAAQVLVAAVSHGDRLQGQGFQAEGTVGGSPEGEEAVSLHEETGGFAAPRLAAFWLFAFEAPQLPGSLQVGGRDGVVARKQKHRHLAVVVVFQSYVVTD